METLKRIDIGGRMQADTTGLGDWEVGIITDYDKKAGVVTFRSARDGEEIRINRQHCYKATKAELEEAEQEGIEQEQHDTEVEEFEKAMIGEIAPATIDEVDEADDSKNIVPSKYRSRYHQVESAKGKRSLDNGDPVAQALRGLELADVYQVVASELGEDHAELEERYAHLNPGQQRMVLGNKLRAYWRKMQEES